jgi:hypothetical protein
MALQREAEQGPRQPHLKIVPGTLATIAVYEKDYLKLPREKRIHSGAFREELVGYAEITPHPELSQLPELTPVLSIEQLNKGKRIRQADVYRQSVRARRQAERAQKVVESNLEDEQRRISELPQRQMVTNNEGNWLRTEYLDRLYS